MSYHPVFKGGGANAAKRSPTTSHGRGERAQPNSTTLLTCCMLGTLEFAHEASLAPEPAPGRVSVHYRPISFAFPHAPALQAT